MSPQNAQSVKPPSSMDWWLIAAILVVACLLRVLYLVEIKDTPEFSQPLVDAGFHYYWGQAIVTGDWTPPHGQVDPQIRSTPFLRPPGYPYFLSGVFRIVGVGFWAPRIVQMTLGLASCLLAYALGRGWYSRGVAVVYAASMATHWSFIYFESRFLEPSLVIFLLLSSVYLSGRWLRVGARKHAALAGLAMGLAAAARPNVLLLVPAALLWMVRFSGPSTRRKRAVRAGLVMLAGALLPIAPLAIRNAIVADDLVLISANGGVNLFIGNNSRADGFYFGGLEGVGEFATCYDYPRLVRNVERNVGRSMKHSEVSRYFARRAIEFVVSHPLDALWLTIRKAWMFWAPYEISHNYVVEYDRNSSPVLRRLPFEFASLTSGALLGLIVSVWRWRHVRRSGGDGRGEGDALSLLVVALTVAYAVSFLPFFNAALYRVPVIPFLMMLVASAVTSLWELAAARKFRLAALGALGWLVLYSVCAAPVIAYQPDRTEWLHKKGIAFARSGRTLEAARLFREALAATPHNVVVRSDLADVLLQMGENEAALREWTEALRIDPHNAAIRVRLGHALRRLGMLAEAAQAYEKAIESGADTADPYFNLANLHSMHGQFGRAIELFRAGLRIDNRACAGQTGLGLALARSGDSDRGIAHCAEAVRLCPDLVEARMNLGSVLVNAERAEEALPHFRHVHDMMPGHPLACHNLGSAFEQLHRLEEAKAWYQRALAAAPDLELSLRNLGLLLLSTGRASEAIPLMARLCELNPSDTEARLALARAYGATGQNAQAENHYRQVLAADPTNVAALQAIENLRDR